MTFPAVALGDQWTAVLSPHTVTAAEMKARIDDQINLMAAEVATWGHDFPVLIASLHSAYSTAAANIPFTADYDSAGGWDATNHWYVVPAGGGLYVASCSAVESTATNNNMTLTGMTARQVTGSNVTLASNALSIYCMARLAGGEHIAAQQGGAGTLVANASGVIASFLTIAKVGN